MTLAAQFRITPFDEILRLRVQFQNDARSLGDTNKREVVRRRPKPSAGHYQIGATTERRSYLIDYAIGFIADYGYVTDSPAHPADDAAEIIRVGVLHKTEKDFVSDRHYFDIDHERNYKVRSVECGMRNEERVAERESGG
jgi:hypothetical protein